MDTLNKSDQVVANIRKIIRAVDLQSKKLIKQYGLTGPQLIILREIEKDSTLSSAGIARNVSLSQATVTSIIDRLEKQDLAVRKKNEIDRRRVNIILTKKAELILEQNPPLLQEDFSEKFEKMNEWEQTMLLSSLQRLVFLFNAEEIQTQPVLVTGSIPETSKEISDLLEDGEFIK